MSDAVNEKEAKKALEQISPESQFSFKTKLEYGTDYKIGDILNTRFYGKDTCISERKLVSEIHLWSERGDMGASPTLTDIDKEDKNVI